MPSLIEQVHQSYSPLYGLPCWNARHGHGSFLTFEFGEPHLEIHEPQQSNPSHSPAVQKALSRRRAFVHGEWHLWIYCCDWLATIHGDRVGESGEAGRMVQAAAALDGQVLLRVEADLERGRWYFDFDLGGRLETRRYVAGEPYAKPAAKQWHLYEPGGHVLTVRADGFYQHVPRDASPDERAWLPPTAP